MIDGTRLAKGVTSLTTADVQHYLEVTILPVLRLQPGFKRLVVMRDADDKVVTISFWATEADEQATFSREYLRDVLNDSLPDTLDE